MMLRTSATVAARRSVSGARRICRADRTTLCHLSFSQSRFSAVISTIESDHHIQRDAAISPFSLTCEFSTDSSNTTHRGEKAGAYSKLEGLNFRATTKLNALGEAKAKRKDAKRAYEASRYDDEMLNDDESTSELSTLLDEWLESERALSLAYQQAIKYVARTRDADAALNAHKLLEEMIERAGAPPTDHPPGGDIGSIGASSTELKLQVMVKMIGERGQDRKGILPDINVPFPPPERKDFMNVLRSWYQSKARKKGLYAEALLLRMAELAYWYPDVFDTLPVSKTFSIVVQCHAGSTHSQSLKKVVHLHAIHAVYAQNHVPGIHRDDPFLFMASLKALKNYRKREELELGEMWLSRLHSFVMDPTNRELYVSEHKAVNDNAEENDGAVEDTTDANDGLLPPVHKLFSVSSAYVKHIRELARLRGMDGAAAMARTALDQMQEVAADPNSFVFMDIKVNSYNLVIGLYRDSKKEGYSTEAVYLLDKMISSWKQRHEETDSTVPFPNEHSFAFAIQSLAYVKDGEAVLEEFKRLLDEYESMCEDGVVEASTKPYNAAIGSLTMNLRNSPHLLSHVSEMVARMNERSEKYPEIEPDVKTSAFVLKACSLVSGDEANRSVAYATAKGTFEELEECETEVDDKTRMTDECYFQMMRCITNLVYNQDEKQEKIKELFVSACRKGLCSANILKVFRNTVSEDDYTATVGAGRLADNWVANVDGGKALYTDGTTGGKGKHARRKGKSTSDWAKKQRKKETEQRLRQVAKAERKEVTRKKRQGATM
mmetsp:Transcript_34413/g.75330  ORF Transcript_34413/g.75330 Transcript_34413/m.75330 type:complete len:777 (+) Transcript_34413:132-2462(+)